MAKPKKDVEPPTREEVIASLPLYGIFQYPTPRFTIQELDTLTISKEIEWLRKYYLRHKRPMDLERIKELKGEMKRREDNALDNQTV